MLIEHNNTTGGKWLNDNLVCPRDHRLLRTEGTTLVCEENHRYPVIEGVPVMLLDDVDATHGACHQSLAQAHGPVPIEDVPKGPEEVDPFVQKAVLGTCGIMYKPLLGKLSRYPIPELRLPVADGQVLLDIGCNWGRWCISAARRGYSPVGIDPSLDAILAARRVCRQLGLRASFVVADARYLPFMTASMPVVFSYSVIQHFSKEDARRAIREVGRVLQPGGTSLIQMPNALGLRSLYHQSLRLLRGSKQNLFDVRYWRVPELASAFQAAIGPTTLSVDGFFGLGIQANDLDLLPARYAAVVQASERLRRLTASAPAMLHFADSLYCLSVRP